MAFLSVKMLRFSHYKSVNHSALSILMHHGIISLPDLTSYSKMYYLMACYINTEVLQKNGGNQELYKKTYKESGYLKMRKIISNMLLLLKT